MEYNNWTIFRNNSTSSSSGASYGLRGHNGHSTNPTSAWETTTTTPSSEDLLAARNHPDPSLTVLKLGKRHYFHQEVEEEEDAAGPPPKNGKACSIAPRCQVEGCDSVLLTAKEYHRRHKVCEVHAKAPRVLLLGIQQRFCQQCSRFHELAEFDESKRSCRRRLAGHNLRRRKTSQEQHSLGRQPHSLNTRECALSLLSSSTNYHPCCWPISPPSDDLPARCSAALRELIAENRAYNSAHRQLYHIDECSNDTNYKHGLSREAVGHVTLDLMQDPGSAFGLLSVHGHKAPKEGNASDLWRLPLGYS